MAELFKCPSCGGRLSYDGGDHATVRCEYCGHTVIVPQSLRQKSNRVADLYGNQQAMHEVVRLINDGQHDAAAHLFGTAFGVDDAQAHEAVSRLAAGLSLSTQHINIQTRSSGKSTAGRWGCVIVSLALVIVLIIGALPFLGGAALISFFSGPFSATGGTEVTEVEDIIREQVEGINAAATIAAGGAAAPGAAAQSTGYATLIAGYGSEGIAPGQFVDPRALAVAPDGLIYVADYSNGRVQQLDNEGASQGVWQWDRDRVIQALAVGSNDDLYAIQGGDLVRFSRADGQPLGNLTYESETLISFRDVAVTPGGEIVALNNFGEIARFDASGNPLHVIDLEAAAISNADNLTVDGRGHVYLLGNYEDALGKRQDGVFMFDSQGRYLSRFGSSGREPGQFTSPGAIAVDGQGRIHISDFGGIMTFDNSGGYLGLTNTEGFIFGLALNSAGELIATGNANKIFRYELPAMP